MVFFCPVLISAKGFWYRLSTLLSHINCYANVTLAYRHEGYKLDMSAVQIVTTVDTSTIFGMMIPCDIAFKFSLGVTWKKSNMTTIFKMAARYFK